MNWRGDWDVNEQYYGNDVVRSGVNLASYILNGQTALRGGADPSANPDWIELSATTTGVLQVVAGTGIALDPAGTATIPIIDNTGILSITAGAGINVTGGVGAPPLNATITNTGILQVQSGLGINVTNGAGPIPIINNNGVRTIQQGGGITVNNADPNNPTVSANIQSIGVSSGLTVTNPTGPTPTLLNTGVLDITAGNGISVTGSKTNYTISSAIKLPRFSYITVQGPQTGTVPLQPYATDPFNSVYSLVIDNNPFLINLSLTAGDAGAWVIDFSGVQFWADKQVINAAAPIEIFIQDNGNNQYFIPASQGGVMNIADNSGSIQTYGLANGGQCYIEPAVVKAAGCLGIRVVGFRNNTGTPIYYTTKPNGFPCYYYPSGAE